MIDKSGYFNLFGFESDDPNMRFISLHLDAWKDELNFKGDVKVDMKVSYNDSNLNYVLLSFLFEHEDGFTTFHYLNIVPNLLFKVEKYSTDIILIRNEDLGHVHASRILNVILDNWGEFKSKILVNYVDLKDTFLFLYKYYLGEVNLKDEKLFLANLMKEASDSVDFLKSNCGDFVYKFYINEECTLSMKLLIDNSTMFYCNSTYGIFGSFKEGDDFINNSDIIKNNYNLFKNSILTIFRVSCLFLNTTLFSNKSNLSNLFIGWDNEVNNVSNNNEDDKNFDELDLDIFKNDLISINDKILNILINKNKSYGSSFEKTIKEYGESTVLVRFSDKFNRLKHLYKVAYGKEESTDIKESIEDCLLDIIGYSLLMLVFKKNNPNLVKGEFLEND